MLNLSIQQRVQGEEGARKSLWVFMGFFVIFLLYFICYDKLIGFPLQLEHRCTHQSTPPAPLSTTEP